MKRSTWHWLIISIVQTLLFALYLVRNDTSWPSLLTFGLTFVVVSLAVRQGLLKVFPENEKNS